MTQPLRMRHLRIDSAFRWGPGTVEGYRGSGGLAASSTLGSHWRSGFGFAVGLLLWLAWCPLPSIAAADSPDALFQAGAAAYRAGDYTRAAEAFRESVTLRPASGALQNLGNAEWQRDRAGAAILARDRKS